MKILFLVKKNYDYGNYIYCKAGLMNSAKFASDALIKHLGIKSEVRICVDGNSIDKEVHQYKPNFCILEAIWVTPTKIAELVKLHPSVHFVIRIHSKTTFLAMEGMSITWIKEYNKIPGVVIAFNNTEPDYEFGNLGITSDYLPNIYNDVKNIKIKFFDYFKSENNHRKDIKIGCFGAIRPLKNQLQQAMGSIIYADQNHLKLYFHINATRIEQHGENVIKNIRALFKDTNHELVEHPWLEHNAFLDLVKTMDVGLQVSLTESFNIVTADFVYEKIPIIVSDDINWMPEIAKIDPANTKDLISKIDISFHWGKILLSKSIDSLNTYNQHSLDMWKLFLYYKS